MLRVIDVARTLGLHPRTVRRLILAGVLPALRPGSRNYRIAPKAFREFLAARQVNRGPARRVVGRW